MGEEGLVIRAVSQLSMGGPRRYGKIGKIKNPKYILEHNIYKGYRKMSLLRILKGVNNLSLARCPNFIQRSKAKINVKYEID